MECNSELEEELQSCQWLRNRHHRRHGCDNYAENNAINLRMSAPFLSFFLPVRAHARLQPSQCQFGRMTNGAKTAARRAVAETDR